MKLSKKGGGIAVAVVMAGGIAAATTTSALAAPAGTPHVAPAAKGAAKHDKRARFLTGLHGERTVKDKDGKTVTREWQVGKVTAASGSSLTVTSGDGVSWTWTTSSDTKVRSPKHAAPKVGDQVLVEGVKSGAANDARVVVDPDQAKVAKWLDHPHAKKPATSDQGKQTPKGKHRKAPDGTSVPSSHDA